MKAPWLVLILGEIFEPILGDSPLCHANDTDIDITGRRSNTVLSRRKRHLAFPKGSAFVVTLTLLKAIQVKEPSNWNLDLEFDMIWPIPPYEDLRVTSSRKPAKIKRRHRRELYKNFELALDSQNLPGRLCVLLIICEAKHLLNPPGFSFIEDLLHVILRNSDETRKPDPYDLAYRTDRDCTVIYPCPLSLLQFFLINLYAEPLS